MIEPFDPTPIKTAEDFLEELSFLEERYIKLGVTNNFLHSVYSFGAATHLNIMVDSAKITKEHRND